MGAENSSCHIDTIKRFVITNLWGPLAKRSVHLVANFCSQLFRVILAHAEKDHRFSLTAAEVQHLGESQVGIDASSVKLAPGVSCTNSPMEIW